MINMEDVIEDHKNDEIGKKISEMQSHTAGSKIKREAISELCELMKSKKYISFESGAKYYATIRVGESFLYDVPTKKTGHLMGFRGKRVRVVCVGSGKYDKRSYMAGNVEI